MFDENRLAFEFIRKIKPIYSLCLLGLNEECDNFIERDVS